MTCCWEWQKEIQICHFNQFYSSVYFPLMLITFFRRESTCWKRQNSDQAKALALHNHPFRCVPKCIFKHSEVKSAMLIFPTSEWYDYSHGKHPFLLKMSTKNTEVFLSLGKNDLDRIQEIKALGLNLSC